MSTTAALTEPRVDEWSRRSEHPLTAAAALFLVVYAWPILHPGLHGGWRTACHAIDLATWVLFAADYVVRVGLARHRTHFVLHHLPDLVIVALPIFRPLRLLRLVLLLRVLNRQAADSFRGRVITYVTGATLMLIFCAALAVLDAERGHPGSNIHNFGDAVWWCFATITTVGYGDFYPVTVTGRFVAVGLMIGGVALIGVVTATFASWLVDRVRDVSEEAEQAEERELGRLRDEVRSLRAEIGALRADLARAGRTSGPA